MCNVTVTYDKVSKVLPSEADIYYNNYLENIEYFNKYLYG